MSEPVESAPPTALRAPFPWAGGKSRAAGVVWTALGDAPVYIEPFAGSLAVLLARPSAPGFEVVNDADGFIANFWRAVAADPDAVARAADWPVNEVDLTARHLRLVEQRDRLTRRLMGDPAWCDVELAGWWAWGVSAWFGSGWCGGDGPWQADTRGELFKVGRHKRNGDGVVLQHPHLSGFQGVHGKTPVLDWLRALQERLRRVVVCCGDWARVVAGSTGNRVSSGYRGFFFDPPYGSTRCGGLYAKDSTRVYREVLAWCVAHGAVPDTRIVLAGFEGEGCEALETRGWCAVEWHGGSRTYYSPQQHRERLWLSPQCEPVQA